MARPIGSKNKPRPRPVRKQYQIRLTKDEHMIQEETAYRAGLTWGEWARHVLRKACGLDALAPYENPTKTEEPKQST